MLINGSRLASYPVLSLHVGGPIARISELVIDPNNLRLIAARVTGPLIRGDVGNILPMDSVREFSHVGIIIDSVDELVDGEDIVRIQKILDLNFALPGLKVVTKSGAKLGKVSDFVLNTTSWNVHQLVVQRPIMKSFLDPELLIPRSEIIEVDDYKVVVKDEQAKVSAKSAKVDFAPDFVNPFRKPDFADRREEI